jgi:putrescine aminotransferase
VAHDAGAYLKRAFGTLAEHPLVGSAETCGFMAGLNLVKRKAENVHYQVRFDPALGVGMLCRAHMFNTGIIMRAVGDRMIIAPPLVMTHAQIDEMVALIRRALDLTLEQVRAKGWV